jgi:hypothetical protein
MVDVSYPRVPSRAVPVLLILLTLDGNGGVGGSFLVPRSLGRYRYSSPTASPLESPSHGLRNEKQQWKWNDLVGTSRRLDGCVPPLLATPSGNDNLSVPTDVLQPVDPPRRSLLRRESVKISAFGQLAVYILASMCAAAAVIGWESVIGEHSLPSRQTRSRIVALRNEADLSRSSGLLSNRVIRNGVFRGERTVRGMGFGLDDRRLLYLQDQPNDSVAERTDGFTVVTEGESYSPLLLLPDRPSYNEVMEQHRQDTVDLWKRLYRDDTKVSTQELRGAIRDVLLALESMDELKRLATNYQWEDLRDTLRSSRWQSDLNRAAALIRQVKYETVITQSIVQGRSEDSLSRLLLSSTVGFDWGSCAWRHACGAWADWQESIDQIDALLGVLEPQEVLFCIDVVERSVREVLSAIPPSLWDPSDWRAFEAFPKYEPYVFSDESNGSFGDGAGGVETEDLDPYIRALMDLRID